MRTVTGSTKIVGNDFGTSASCADGPKGEIHAYMDVGGRAMQEQLSTMYFVILPAQPYNTHLTT